jgi:hypothetical protein
VARRGAQGDLSRIARLHQSDMAEALKVIAHYKYFSLSGEPAIEEH